MSSVKRRLTINRVGKKTWFCEGLYIPCRAGGPKTFPGGGLDLFPLPPLNMNFKIPS